MRFSKLAQNVLTQPTAEITVRVLFDSVNESFQSSVSKRTRGARLLIAFRVKLHVDATFYGFATWQ